MTKFTPGPWFKGRDTNNIISRTPNTIVAEVNPMNKGRDCDLISAAPELLESTISFMELLDVFDMAAFKTFQNEPPFFELMVKIRKMRAVATKAIERATGELDLKSTK